MVTDKCDECGKDVVAKKSVYEFDNGEVVESDDTFKAECDNCGNSWLIAYYS